MNNTDTCIICKSSPCRCYELAHEKCNETITSLRAQLAASREREGQLTRLLDFVGVELAGTDYQSLSHRICEQLNALSPPSDGGVGGWQEIETAPRDGTKIIIASISRDGTIEDIDFDAFWTSERESWEMPQVYFYWASAYGRVEEPTHWMPLPPPPTQA
jgi:hypothetical protein